MEDKKLSSYPELFYLDPNIDYMGSAFFNVRLVCNDGTHVRTHGVLLAANCQVMREILEDVGDKEEGDTGKCTFIYVKNAGTFA